MTYMLNICKLLNGWSGLQKKRASCLHQKQRADYECCDSYDSLEAAMSPCQSLRGPGQGDGEQ